MILRPITIVGGGLAGLTLGVGLRQRGVPVLIYEAGHYPRHRVCGEFISGRGLETLNRLNLLSPLLSSGAERACTAAFFTEFQPLPARQLPEPALCISRFKLDCLLAEQFQKLGGQLVCNNRWTDKTTHEGVVRATGRRLRKKNGDWHWFGIKAHALGVELSADLEMHAREDGYVGLARLSGGKVNVCALLRRRFGESVSFDSRMDLFAGDTGSLLAKKLSSAEWQPESFSAVAALPVIANAEQPAEECCIGDAIGMIAPMTGNGMSMAFESAELALGPLEAYSRRESSWKSTRALVNRACRSRFARRLSCGAWLQSALLHPFARDLLLRIGHQRILWDLLFRITR
jgi:menaquinone-9 beta-reductase